MRRCRRRQRKRALKDLVEKKADLFILVGTSLQVLRVNAGATALEWATSSALSAGTTTNSTLRWSGTAWVENTGVLSNPYHIALGLCLEALRNFLAEKQQDHLQTHVVVECRGKKEDSELELEFRRICDGENAVKKHLPFNVIFADKKTNLTGLQLADLVARPVGLSYIRPTQANQAFDLLKKKFYCAGGRTRGPSARKLAATPKR